MAFMDFVRRIAGRMTNRLFPKVDFERKLNVKIAMSYLMDNAINEWLDMYSLPGRTTSLNLAASIAEEFARLMLTEFEFVLEGNARADYINEQLKGFIWNLDKTVELWCALGGIILKPYILGEDTPSGIAVDIVKPNRFFPTAFDSNSRVTGGVFIETKHIGEYIYTRLEYHNLEGEHYTVINRAYRSKRLESSMSTEDDLVVNSGFLLEEEVSLDSVEGWGNLEPQTDLDGITHPLFVYVKVPEANTIDPESPLGPSVYAKAVSTILEADKQYSRILWEYEATEAAVDADVSVFETNRNGEPIIPEGRDRLYRTYDIGGSSDKPFFHIFSPEIRDSNLFNGLNELMRKIEFQCGLAYGTLSDVSDTDKTATEIRASKQRSYAKVNRMQKTWDLALDELIEVMGIYCGLYGIVPDAELEKTCTWGDSILEDTDAEYQRRWTMVVAGKYKLEKFYAWYFGCTEEEAMELIPAQAPTYPPLE